MLRLIQGLERDLADLLATGRQLGRDRLSMVGQSVQFGGQRCSTRVPRVVVQDPQWRAFRERARELVETFIRAPPDQGDEQVIQRRKVILNEGRSHTRSGGDL